MLELMSLPVLPPLGAHLWRWFGEIAATRAGNGIAPTRLTRAEIRAWERDERHRLELWERRAILAIDAAWLASLK